YIVALRLGQLLTACHSMSSSQQLHQLRQDAAIALRQLRRGPGFAIVATLTLALGIGATTAVFAVVDAVLLRPLPFRDPSSLVLVKRERPGGAPVEMTYPEYRDVRDGARFFDGLAASPSAIPPSTWTDGTSNEPVAATSASGNLFDVLGARALLGRTLTPEDDRRGAAPSLVLGYGVWMRRFGGNGAVIGQRAELNGTQYTIVGVMPRGFEYPRGAEAWIALVPAIDTLVDNRQIAFLNVVGRVRSGVSMTAARHEAERLLAQSAAAAGIPAASVAAPQLTSLEDELLGGARRGMIVVLAAAALVLLVACANVANLLLARAATREGEIAVRTALGAGRGRLVRQFLAEALVLAGIGTVLGLGACFLARGAIGAMVPADLYRAGAVEVDVRVAGFTALLMVATTLLFGVLPAFRGTRVQPGSVLRAATGRTTSAGSARRTQRSLVAAEVALAVVLLIGGGVLLRSFARLNAAPLGFDRTHALTAEIFLPEARYGDLAKARTFYRDAVARLTQLPGVSGAGGVLLRPLAGPDGFDYPLTLEGSDADTQRRQPLVNYEAMTPGYLQAAGIPLLQGRDITAADNETSSRVAIVSAAMAKLFWPNASPIGKRLKWGAPDSPAPWIEVIGVAGSARYRDPRTETLDVYVPYTQSPWRLNHLVVRAAGDPASLAASVRAALREIDPEARATQVATVGELASVALRQPRFQVTLVGTFAALALLLGAVGIFGVVSFATARRTRELGVRMALGARGSDVQWLVVGETLRTVGVGVAVGMVAAIAGARVLRALVYDVSATDPLTFVVVPVIVVAVAVLAAIIPARRASRVDPVAILRMD
ncbi:MAG TPA: ABC transporter permease, partial [Gemmatimonadaceae bacterium]|nr:ABC transporter permease [Gemmatimonadaceae bacterium]